MTDHELRVLIATKVCGCEIIRETAGYDNWMETPDHRIITWDDGGTPYYDVAGDWWCPLTDLNAAMEALEAFVKMNGIDYGDFEFGVADGKMCWNVVIGPRESSSADTLPRAICLALAEAAKETA